jgi:hypothetical protein
LIRVILELLALKACKALKDIRFDNNKFIVINQNIKVSFNILVPIILLDRIILVLKIAIIQGSSRSLNSLKSAGI